MQLYCNGTNYTKRLIVTVVALAVVSGAATVPGLAEYRKACTREVQARPAKFFDAASDRTCAQARKDFRVFSKVWHPDKNADGLTTHKQQELFKCANSAHQRMMRPCESPQKRWNDEEFDSMPRHHHDDIHDDMCFCLKLLSLVVVLFANGGVLSVACNVYTHGLCFYTSQCTPAAPDALRVQLCDIDVVAQHEALQERAQERAPYREMGVYRHGGYMVLQRSTVATVRFRPSV